MKTSLQCSRGKFGKTAENVFMFTDSAVQRESLYSVHIREERWFYCMMILSCIVSIVWWCWPWHSGDGVRSERCQHGQRLPVLSVNYCITLLMISHQSHKTQEPTIFTAKLCAWQWSYYRIAKLKSAISHPNGNTSTTSKPSKAKWWNLNYLLSHNSDILSIIIEKTRYGDKWTNYQQICFKKKKNKNFNNSISSQYIVLGNSFSFLWKWDFWTTSRETN